MNELLMLLAYAAVEGRTITFMTDPLDLLMLGMRYLHILGAIALMGGTIFARFAVLPSIRTLAPHDQEELHAQIRSRWSKFVMVATLMLLVSGVANMGINGMKFQFSTFHAYHIIASIKLLLALPIFFLAALLTGRSNLARKVQANGKMWLTVNLVLALVMVLIGGGLRFAHRVPKEAKPPVAVDGNGDWLAATR